MVGTGGGAVLTVVTGLEDVLLSVTYSVVVVTLSFLIQSS